MSILEKYQRGTGARRGYNKKTGKFYLKRGQSNYLHFHMSSIDVEPPVIIEDAKSQILTDFAYGFAKLNSPSSWRLQNMNFEQLRSFLEVWKSAPSNNHAAGQAMADMIAEKLQLDAYTGTGIEKGFNQAFEHYGSFNSLSSTEVLAEADYLLTEIERLLTSYINAFWGLEEPALLDKSFQLYQQGKKVSSNIFSKFNSRMFTQPDIQNIDAKVESTFSTLENILTTLNEVASMGRAGMSGGQIASALTAKEITKFDPVSLAKSVGSIFNALGGEAIGETVGAYAAQHLKEKDLKEVDEMIKQLFNTNGFTTVTTDTSLGQSRVNVGGHMVQQKGDWSIIIQNGDIIVNIPASQKLYQPATSGNAQSSYITAKMLPLSITAQSIGLNSLLQMTLSNPTTGMSWFEQHLAVLSRDDEDIVNMGSADSVAVNLWNDFKEAAQWLGLFRALVGTGGATKQGIDFAALLIVNNQIFSIADILKHLTTGQTQFLFPPLPDFDTIRTDVSGSFGVGTPINEINIKERQQTQYREIRKWWGKRFKIEIDMAMAASL